MIKITCNKCGREIEIHQNTTATLMCSVCGNHDVFFDKTVDKKCMECGGVDRVKAGDVVPFWHRTGKNTPMHTLCQLRAVKKGTPAPKKDEPKEKEKKVEPAEVEKLERKQRPKKRMKKEG